jgi:hypothetical protein
VVNVGAVAKLTGIIDKIHIVISDQYLKRRDHKDFAVYWKLLGIDETEVQYHADLDFEPELNSLIICDEADRFMIEEPAKFEKIINGCFCICFTGTPDNSDSNGIQRHMIGNL